MNETKPMLSLTRNQREIFEALYQIGAMHFSGFAKDSPMPPRVYPLIAGPTGSGKSFLVKEVARCLGAHYFPITYGNWMPQGTKEGQYTLFALLDVLEDHPWVVFHIDELDKGIASVGGWGRAVSNDIWNVLDLRLPLRDWARKKTMTPDELSAFEQGIRQRLWIVGSGTWQMVFENRRKPSLVFGGEGSDTSESTVALIYGSRAIPKELTARFNAEPMILRYPTCEHEIRGLLEQFGITRLAEELGESIDPSKIHFEEHGMRVLESILGDLMLRKFQKDFAPDGDFGEALDASESPLMVPFIQSRLEAACGLLEWSGCEDNTCKSPEPPPGDDPDCEKRAEAQRKMEEALHALQKTPRPSPPNDSDDYDFPDDLDDTGTFAVADLDDLELDTLALAEWVEWDSFRDRKCDWIVLKARGMLVPRTPWEVALHTLGQFWEACTDEATNHSRRQLGFRMETLVFELKWLILEYHIETTDEDENARVDERDSWLMEHLGDEPRDFETVVNILLDHIRDTYRDLRKPDPDLESFIQTWFIRMRLLIIGYKALTSPPEEHEENEEEEET